MSFELTWLVYTILLTSVLWVPYILNRITVRGLMPAMGYSSEIPHSPWAARALKAHDNAVENLVLFAPLVLICHVADISTSVTRTAVVIYFFARLVHYLSYTFAVPVIRTLIFVVSWCATIALALSALGMIG